jgi:hypothetical protein
MASYIRLNSLYLDKNSAVPALFAQRLTDP